MVISGLGATESKWSCKGEESNDEERMERAAVTKPAKSRPRDQRDWPLHPP